MRAIGRILPLLATAALLRAASPEVYNFPALVYGTDQWSVVKLENHGRETQSIVVEAFDDLGRPVPMPEQTPLAPGEAREIRLPFPAANKPSMGWAKVTVLRDRSDKSKTRLEVSAAVEHLENNKLLSVARRTEPIQTRSAWAVKPPNRSFIYLLNRENRSVDLTYCWWDAPKQNACPPKKAIIGHAKIPAGQALMAGVEDSRGRVLVLKLDHPSQTLFTSLSKANQSVKNYSTNSTLTFDLPEPH